MEPNGLIAFATPGEWGALDVRVNFGMFAGREATAAELEELGRRLLREVGSVTVVAEQRHEFDAAGEAAVHQVRISVAAEETLAEPGLGDRVVAVAEEWASSCIADRHAEITEG